jgi:glycogen synthase
VRTSIVINTYNRAASLATTLEALRHQQHEDFEVVVVNGPSTDDTEQLVKRRARDARFVSCPEAKIAVSRNIGIAAAAGDVVAFIDDDAIPEPDWLVKLLAGYADDAVGGVGGFVLDHTGFAYQWRYVVCGRLGGLRADVAPPLDRFVRPGADPSLYLQGTNCSFRRECLVAIGGFDESFEHYYDDVGVALRVIDSGRPLTIVPEALVHHKVLTNRVRDGMRTTVRPFALVADHATFVLRNGSPLYGRDTAMRAVEGYAEQMREQGARQLSAGMMTAAQHQQYEREIVDGLEVGCARGIEPPSRRELPAADVAAFRPYERVAPEGRRLTICFTSKECPPRDHGGVGRYSYDLAAGIAALGHDVHLVTSSADASTIDFADGVWLHRLAPWDPWIPELEGVALAPNLAHATAIYHEIARIHARTPVDLVSAPLWLCEGVVCALDRRFPTVLTLMTAMKTIASMHPSWSASAQVAQLIELEHCTVARARHIHAISEAILEKTRRDYRVHATDTFVVPLGVRDRRADFPRRAGGGRTRILFVSRLERRKGVDLFLQAAVAILAKRSDVEFVLVGKDTPHTEMPESYRQAFARDHGATPAIAGGVTFVGEVPEDRLYQYYADADVFCLPSRYESFGLVLLEAMMFGRPVVATRVGGIPEVVEDGGSGLLVDVDDVPALVTALEAMLDDAALRNRLGQRSRALFEERFTMSVMARDTLAAYRRVIEDERTSQVETTSVGAH